MRRAKPPIRPRCHRQQERRKPASARCLAYSHLYGGIPGGQAEFVRVPKANVGPFRIPDGLTDEQVLFLSDILPTAYQAVQNAEIGQGSSVAIFGAGPVGLLQRRLRTRCWAPRRSIMVDHHPYRLEFRRRSLTARSRSTSMKMTIRPNRFIQADERARCGCRRSTLWVSKPRAAPPERSPRP